jgi:hypothetical protein
VRAKRESWWHAQLAFSLGPIKPRNESPHETTAPEGPYPRRACHLGASRTAGQPRGRSLRAPARATPRSPTAAATLRPASPLGPQPTRRGSGRTPASSRCTQGASRGAECRGRYSRSARELLRLAAREASGPFLTARGRSALSPLGRAQSLGGAGASL